ncbi:MAG: hypothetical protein KTR31_09245 [Myxococcales bacterium]|nr:hypothetical protein [Myxococcales bacterium]
MSDEFCSPFDRALAHDGPPAVFLVDREGRLRMDPEWTRDAWGRHPMAEGPLVPTWCLARDRDSGFVMLVFTTSATLLHEHPRLDVRTFADAASAHAALDLLGIPAIRRDPW